MVKLKIIMCFWLIIKVATRGYTVTCSRITWTITAEGEIHEDYVDGGICFLVLISWQIIYHLTNTFKLRHLVLVMIVCLPITERFQGLIFMFTTKFR